jgi:hypothetical protein
MKKEEGVPVMDQMKPALATMTLIRGTGIIAVMMEAMTTGKIQ